MSPRKNSCLGCTPKLHWALSLLMGLMLVFAVQSPLSAAPSAEETEAAPAVAESVSGQPENPSDNEQPAANPDDNGQPVAAQNDNVQPAADQNGNGQPAADQNGNGQPAANQNGNGQPAADQNGNGQPAADQNGNGQPAADQNGNGQPAADQNSAAQTASGQEGLSSISKTANTVWQSTGLSQFATLDGLKKLVMICVSLLLIYLAIGKGFEPLLLLPIGMGGLLANIPNAGIAEPGGFLNVIYNAGIETGLFPLLIFMGVGAMTDFGPLIANPRMALLGGAAQFGIFFSLIGALCLTEYSGGFVDFSLKDAASIGIIGGADGPTAIFLTSRLSPDLLGSIAVAAYSYMALVPIIQPPIMKALTSEDERNIVMRQLRPVSKLEKIVFPLMVLLLCAFLLPSAAPLMGALMFGNLARECGVVNRLSDTMQNALCNIVTIMLGTAVGSKLAAEKFLTPETLGILLLGLCAFCVGTASGVLLAKLMNKFSKEPINPLIGAAGVSAVPMAARVVNKVGLESNPRNFLLMHAMGPNVSGVIGSAVAAGLLLALLGGKF